MTKNACTCRKGKNMEKIEEGKKILEKLGYVYDGYFNFIKENTIIEKRIVITPEMEVLTSEYSMITERFSTSITITFEESKGIYLILSGMKEGEKI